MAVPDIYGPELRYKDLDVEEVKALRRGAIMGTLDGDRIIRHCEARVRAILGDAYHPYWYLAD
jgi:hypothetical protein